MDEEKKRRLEAWKKQKLQQQSKAAPTGSSAPAARVEESSGNNSAAMEERRKRLESWKLKKQEEKAKAAPEKPKVTGGFKFVGNLAASKNLKAPAFNLGSDDSDSDGQSTSAGKRFGNGRLHRVPKAFSAFEEKEEEGERKKMKKSESSPRKRKLSNQDPEYDPLDAFMVGIKNTTVKEEKLSRGELFHNDADALEYSEEEEEDDVSSHMEKLKKKSRHTQIIVDHSKIEYEAFRKKFYIEVPELAKMTKAEVAQYRMSLDGMKVRGKDAPKPVKNWAQCGLSNKVLDILKALKYSSPMPIQAQALPTIMSGRDMIGIAATGSGKTIAFLLPMFRHILDQRALDVGEGAIALIMTPTRELAVQIFTECRKFAKHLGIKGVCVYGGTAVSEQIADLKRGAEIIVCTPGRMIDMLAVNSGKVTNLRRVTYLVLDEADRMFDMGFEPQVKSIVNNTRPDRQTVLFSATFPSQMQKLAMSILTSPVEVICGGRSRVSDDVSQNVVVLPETEKFLKLLELLGIWYEKGSVLVFVERQEKADSVLKDLMRAGYPCLTLHGGMDQNDRDSTIVDFKNGVTKILIATSVAARGLDVRGLNLVVNYDVPNHYEDYVHRVGRTGRAGNKGTSFTFITEDEGKYAEELAKAFENSGIPTPENVKRLIKVFKEENKDSDVKLSSGFGGKGFKFDDSERARVEEMRNIQKASLGLNDSDEENGDFDDTSDLDDEIEKKLAGDVKKRDIEKVEEPAVATASSTSTTTESSALAKAQAIASSLATARLTASQMANNLSKKGNPTSAENADEESAEAEKHHYEAELEINDFPKMSRFKVTNKEAVQQIQEFSGAAMTVRGTFYEPGKNPKPGEERKLYIYIEANTEQKVMLCKNEIKRIIKEQIIKDVQKQKSSGRYKVM
eukprot:Nk52_evm34s248 gene=Nk52_evmTU34s248